MSRPPVELVHPRFIGSDSRCVHSPGAYEFCGSLHQEFTKDAQQNNIVKDLEMDDNPHLHNIVLRPLCPTRWVMRLPAVDAFLAHYASILQLIDELKNDRTEPEERRNWFALCEGNGVEPSIKILRSNFVEETALKFLLPNLHMICTIYVHCPTKSIRTPPKSGTSGITTYKFNDIIRNSL